MTIAVQFGTIHPGGASSARGSMRCRLLMFKAGTRFTGGDADNLPLPVFVG